MRFLLTLLALLVAAPAAQAMGFTEYSTPIAFAPDGLSVLVRVVGHGPEGGGYLRYRVITARKEGNLQVSLSNDASPGDGSTPQQVDAHACRKRLKELKTRMYDLGFRAEKLTTVPCEKDHRYELVEVPPERVLLPVAPVEPETRKYAVGGLDIALVDGSLQVRQAGKEVVPARNVSGTGELTVYAAPNGRMVVVAGTDSRGGTRLLVVLTRDEDEGATYRLVPH